MHLKMDAHIKNYGPQNEKSPTTPKTGRVVTEPENHFNSKVALPKKIIIKKDALGGAREAYKK
tara:strand:+ start:265 stop:453 length:189 start_codon:yes stop_codon:yes gene_type:complete